MIFLGIDTSNYTTSMAIADENHVIANEKITLAVPKDTKGLRQNDAVFAHIKNLPILCEHLGRLIPGAIGYSAYPRDIECSYMPCFIAGSSFARSLAQLYGIKAYPFSHQAGHIMAAIYSAKAEKIIKAPFLAFHVSGGTTELLLVKGGNITLAGKTLDINAGQVIDRTGLKLGLQFPCGPAFEKLAENTSPVKPKICVRGLDCNFSGVENKIDEMIAAGYQPSEIAAYTIEFIKMSVDSMTENALRYFGQMPVIYAGGVMSNNKIRDYIQKKYGAYFAEPDYSCDNAAGIALLCRNMYLKHIRDQE